MKPGEGCTVNGDNMIYNVYKNSPQDLDDKGYIRVLSTIKLFSGDIVTVDKYLKNLEVASVLKYYVGYLPDSVVRNIGPYLYNKLMKESGTLGEVYYIVLRRPESKDYHFKCHDISEVDYTRIAKEALTVDNPLALVSMSSGHKRLLVHPAYAHVRKEVAPELAMCTTDKDLGVIVNKLKHLVANTEPTKKDLNVKVVIL